MKAVIANVTSYGLDGINMDFEGNVPLNSSAYNGLTALMQELRVALMARSPLYTLSMDYVYCPDCVAGRTYNYKVIQNYIDYFILMDYDMQSGQRSKGGLCPSLANAPYWPIYRMTSDFLKAGVSPKKLVMAFPWYG